MIKIRHTENGARHDGGRLSRTGSKRAPGSAMRTGAVRVPASSEPARARLLITSASQCLPCAMNRPDKAITAKQWAATRCKRTSWNPENRVHWRAMGMREKRGPEGCWSRGGFLVSNSWGEQNQGAYHRPFSWPNQVDTPAGARGGRDLAVSVGISVRSNRVAVGWRAPNATSKVCKCVSVQMRA